MHNFTIARILPLHTYPLFYCQVYTHDSWRPPWGRCLSDFSVRLRFFPIPIIMVSGGGLAEGHEIRLGALVFVADDSAWLQEAPLDVDALPVRGATHFRACVRGVLLRQPSTQYRPVFVSSSLPASRRRKRSVGRGFSGG